MINLPLAKSGGKAVEVATQAILEAGEIAVAHFQMQKQVSQKGRGNVVTDVDLLAERKVLEHLQREYPTYGILSEESHASVGNFEFTWIIDPLDGTRNYASNLPHFSVAIALAHGDEVVLGLIYDPLRRELFRAEKGEGAYLNDRPISVSNKTSVQASVLGLDMGYDDEKGKRALQLLLDLWPGMQTVRIMGSAALGLAYAACGRLDLYFHHFLFPWDLAAGVVLVREAGGIVTERDGGAISVYSKGAIAANSAVHADFLKLTRDYPH